MYSANYYSVSVHETVIFIRTVQLLKL